MIELQIFPSHRPNKFFSFSNRFMRGERETNMVNCNFRGNATPSTPSTASTTVRQNPLIYQRMHSNDSDKDGANGSTSGAGRVSD